MSRTKSPKSKISNILMTLNNIEFEKLNLGKSGRSFKLIYDKQLLQIATNTLYMPFNLNKYKKQWSNFEEYTVDCYIDDSKSNNDYIVKLTQFNDSIFDLIKSNKNLFNVPDNEDIIYSSFYRENKTYPKLFKLQLPRDTQGNFLTQFFDENSEKIFVDENNIEELLTKKAIFKTIIGCSKVYLYQGRAGCIWDILQLKFEPKKNYNNLSDNDTCSLSSDEGCSSNNINYVTSNDTNTDKNNDKNNEKNIYNSMSLID